LPRGAVPALEGVVLDEGPLHGVQGAVAGEALDGRDLAPVLHHGQRHAAQDPAPIHEHRAGPALAVIAAFLSSSEIKPFPQKIEKGGPRRDVEIIERTVDREAERYPDRDISLGLELSPRPFLSGGLQGVLRWPNEADYSGQRQRRSIGSATLAGGFRVGISL